jgi:multiple sugar transport system substrate-binding protein
MRRSSFVTTAIALLALGGLAACSGNAPTAGGTSPGTATSGAGGGASVSIWARSDDSPFIDPLVKVYNSSHSDQVQLTIVPAGSSFTQKLGAALASNSGPDLISLNLVYAPYFASTGQLLDVTDKANQLGYLDQLNKSEIRLGTWGDKLYALPFTGDASVLLYNKDLFQKAGLDPSKPPTTWAEIESDAKAITALGGGDYGFYFPGSGSGWNLFTFTPFIWADGGDVLSGDGADQKATLDTPQVKDALGLYRDLWTSGNIPQSAQTDDGTQILTMFAAGKIGMLTNGSYAYSELTSKYPDVHFGVTPIPGKTGGSASFAGGDTLAITKDSKNPDAAWQFIAWATSQEVQQKYIAGAGIIPIRSDAVPSDADANFKGLVQAMETGQTPKSTVYSQLFEDPNGPWANLIHNSVFTGDIDQEVSSAQAAWTSLLAGAAK